MSLVNIDHTRYGEIPSSMGIFNITVNEMMFYLYLPIKLAGQEYSDSNVESRLHVFKPLIQTAMNDYGNCFDKNIYITAKRLFVTPDNPGNRPGYHCDGFLTDDVNYIWTDYCGTIICTQDYRNIVPDHLASIEQFELQSLPENESQLKTYELVKLSPYVVHRTPDITKSNLRTFVKISFSDDKYNLIGNSINSLLSYDWKMYPREVARNHPTYSGTDFYQEI